jgi:hypothetical protein
VQSNEYTIRAVPIEQTPYFTERLGTSARELVNPKSDPYRHYDAEGIVMQRNRDGKWVYNPLRIAMIATQLIMMYMQTPTREIYQALARHLDFLQSTKIKKVRNGLPYYEYRFDFPLHANKAETMRAPWVSGLAQAQVLIVIAHLDKVFSKNFTAWGNKVFKTLIAEPCGKIDADGYYWIDEYPHESVFDRTLNGHINGLMGLYYWHLKTGNDEAETWLKAGITTVEHYMEQYRVPGFASAYCLAHHTSTHKADWKYHRCHVKQFEWLYAITGEMRFKNFKNDLVKDMAA